MGNQRFRLGHVPVRYVKLPEGKSGHSHDVLLRLLRILEGDSNKALAAPTTTFGLALNPCGQVTRNPMLLTSTWR